MNLLLSPFAIGREKNTMTDVELTQRPPLQERKSKSDANLSIYFPPEENLAIPRARLMANGLKGLENYNENKKKKGGKKMSKAERAALKAAYEAEEKMRLEMEERERLERERIELEERAIRETLERERRDTHLPELKAIHAAIEQKSKEMQETRNEKREWSRYMRSDGSPDPTILGQINTFLNVNQSSPEKLEINMLRDDVVLILSLIEELDLILAESSVSSSVKGQSEDLAKTQEELKHLLQFKLDCFTHRMLRDSTTDADKETGNTLKTISADVISLNCWANLACNPRLNTQTFSGVSVGVSGVVFHVPPPLTKTRCGVRFLRTTYDHLSSTSPLSVVRVKTPMTDKGVAIIGVDGEPQPHPSQHTAMTTTTNTTGVTLPPPSPPPLPLSPAALDIEAANSDLSLPEFIDKDFEEFPQMEEVVDLRGFDLVGGVIHFDLVEMPPQPKEVRQWSIVELQNPPIRRMTYQKAIPIDIRESTTTEKSGEEHHVMMEDGNLSQGRSRHTLQSSHSHHGKSKERQSSKKRNSKYVSEENRTTNQAAAAATASKPALQSKSRATVASQASAFSGQPAKENLPFGLNFSLPKDCMFFEDPTLALWDDHEKVWRKSDFDDVSYDKATRTVSLTTYKFGPLGCFQDRHINFPFTGWELRPLSNSSALLTINAALVTVQIEVWGDKCCLRQPTDLLPLMSSLGQWVTPKTLINILRSRGVNIFPYEDSRKYVQIAYKKKWMEEHKSELWGLFLFPEEFDVPEEEPEQEAEDDFLSFLKKPVVEEIEPELEPEPKKKKKGKNKTKNRNVEESENDNTSGDEKEAQPVAVLSVTSSNVNMNKKAKKSVASLASASGKKGRGGKKKKSKAPPKPPQQILWESFNEWLTHYRVKHPSVIENLHREMSLVAHVFAFSSSKWNSDAGESNLVVRAAETTPGDQVAEGAWENFMVCAKRIMPLKLREEDELFSTELKDGGLVMSNFYHMVKHIGSDSARRRLQTVDYAFIETLRQILDATQPLVFS